MRTLHACASLRCARLQQRRAGFTLIELVIVVAIIGILAAIALPSYLSQIQRSRRADAISNLTLVAQQLERCNTLDPGNGYNAGACAAAVTSPPPSTQYYSYAFGSRTAAAYSLTATAIATQPQFKDTECRTFTIISTNASVTSTDSSGVDSTATCMRR